MCFGGGDSGPAVRTPANPPQQAFADVKQTKEPAASRTLEQDGMRHSTPAPTTVAPGLNLEGM